MNRTADTPFGVVLRDLISHRDERGCLTEVFRATWAGEEPFIQWNFVESNPNTLRGVHVHPVHADYLVAIEGCLLLGLHDLRKWSPTYRLSCLVEMQGDQLQGAFIPPGVAHGFYFADKTRYVYGVTDYWNPSDELGCRWNDPQLGIEWPAADPLLSERDREAPSLQALTDSLYTAHLASPMMLAKELGNA